MNRIFSFFAILCCAWSLSAQTDLSHFSGIKSQGLIPQDLRLTLDELYAQDKQRVREYNDGKLKNRDQVLNASYLINKLTASGRVLYGDPLTLMLNRIADTLLCHYPELRQNIRIYTLKSSEVNAFMTGQGMLFVTTGLIAQVENESQLAFIIGHEAIHYYKNHNWESITGRTKKSDRKSEAEQELRDFVRYHNRSHEMENEADSLCLELFYGNSPYVQNTVDGVFDVLQYGYLPFDEMVIDTNFFDTKYYHFSSDKYLETVAPITARDDYDDSKSTHPNLLKRRMACERILDGRRGGQPFVTITAEEFASLRDLARLECIRQDLIYANYTRALYNSQVMLRYMPDNIYLAKAKAEAMYGLSKFRNMSGNNDVVGDYKIQEGEIQQAYHFLRKISTSELNMLAVRELWKSHKQFPQDDNITLMTIDAMKDLTRKHEMSVKTFSATFDTVQKEADTVTQAKSKYDKIKAKRKKQDISNPKTYFFTDLMEADAQMKPFMDSCMLHANDTAVVIDNKGKNMFIYAAEYLIGNKDHLKLAKSDKHEGSLRDQLTSVAEKEGLGVVDFSDQGLRQCTTDKQYNDFVSLNEWVNEFWQSRGKFNRQLTLQPEMNGLVQRYNADRINLTQVVNLENCHDRITFYQIFGSVLFPPLFVPFLVADLSKGYENTLVQSIYVDAPSGKLLSSNLYDFELADEDALVKGSIYDNMQRAKGKEKSTFLGRHLMVGADMMMGLNMRQKHGEILAFTSDSHRESLFQLRPRFNVEYLINQHFSVHATASWSKTMQKEYLANPTQQEYWGTIYYDTTYSESFHKHDIYSFGLGFRKYSQIAPVGTFWGITAQCHTTMLDTLNNPHLLDFEEKVRQLAVGLNFEFGRNYVIHDFIVLNMGMNVGLVGALPFNPNEIAFHEKPQNQHWRNNFAFTQRLWLQNVFMFNIGLGFLPF